MEDQNKLGADKTINVGIDAKFEQTTKRVNAELAVGDPSIQQQQDDDRLIPNVGDSRVMRQNGKIMAPDGMTTIDVELTFVRTRNKTGGVDVNCIVPALSMAGEKT